MKFYLWRHEGRETKIFSEFKVQCAIEGVSMKEKLMTLVKDYLAKRSSIKK